MAHDVHIEGFSRAVAVLSAGRAAVFPTDTVYGIGVAVGLASSPHEIYEVKHRDPDKAIPWLVGNRGALKLYGDHVSPYAVALAERFWPGPLTLIVPAADNVPAAFAGPDRTIAIRMPDDAVALALIDAVGFPLATSSANLQGEKPPRSFADVNPQVAQAVAVAIGDDAPRSGISSTIVDCTGDAPRITRLGAITEHEVEEVARSADA
jgi:L-threonylcarbamoyladenylate synthase